MAKLNELRQTNKKMAYLTNGCWDNYRADGKAYTLAQKYCLELYLHCKCKIKYYFGNFVLCNKLVN